MSGQSPNSPTVCERLAARLSRPVGAESRARAALHVLDWVGCAVAGAGGAAARAMKQALAPQKAADQTLYLGALGNVLEMDDVDKQALLHPGPVVIPAAIGAAAIAAVDAKTFLDGVVRGYEAVIRVGRAVGPDHYRFWHNTGTVGPFGAAAAASSVLGLDQEKTVWALGLAGTQASGFWEVRHEPASHAKQLHTARAAHAGLLAAQLANAGFIGLRSIIEGPQGFFAATCGEADPNKVAAFPENDPWSIHEVSFKPWPACRHAHAAIDAALQLKATGVDPEAIKAIIIRTYGDALNFCDKPDPLDTLSAKFSLQHAAAIALLRGAPDLDAFEQEARDEDAVRSLRQRITVIEGAEFTDRYPARFGAAIDVELFNEEHRRVEIGDALGDPENPVTTKQLLDKGRMLMDAGGLGKEAREAIIETVIALPDDVSFSRFHDQLIAAVRL
ncbi:MAG: MmgE/PrpD family protein [Pseudomonadota bacterium]